MAHRIEIEPTTLGERGPRYRVTYAGTVLLEATRNAELDACRKLHELGLAGQLEVWRKGKPHPDVVITRHCPRRAAHGRREQPPIASSVRAVATEGRKSKWRLL